MGKKQDSAFGIPNSELLPLESPWQFHEQKFGIDISMDRSCSLVPKWDTFYVTDGSLLKYFT